MADGRYEKGMVTCREVLGEGYVAHAGVRAGEFDAAAGEGATT